MGFLESSGCSMRRGVAALAVALAPLFAVAADGLPQLDAKLADALLEAKRASWSRDPVRFARAAAVIPDHHSLSAYVGYWKLRMQLGTGHDDAGKSSALDAAIESYLNRNRGTPVAEYMLRDWLQALGEREDWARFDAWFPRLRLHRPRAILCLAGVSRLAKGKRIERESIDAYMGSRNLRDGCETLADRLATISPQPVQLLQSRLRRALEDNNRSVIRKLGQQLGLPEQALADAIDKPLKVLALGSTGELTVIALSRLGRGDPAQAGRYLEAESTRMAPRDRAFAAAIIAAAAGRDLSADALEHTRRALKAGHDPSLSDRTLSWLARTALIEEDWSTLVEVLGRMSAEERDTPRWTYWHARALARMGVRDVADTACLRERRWSTITACWPRRNSASR
ncbi:MAG: hypothetical protein R3E48_12790 [Burkholderiaceae bacterium]